MSQCTYKVSRRPSVRRRLIDASLTLGAAFLFMAATNAISPASALAASQSGTGGISWYVAPGGTATSCSANSQTDPFSTIQAALTCSASGDTVVVAPSGANPYAGFGTVSDDVSIVAGPGGSARSVQVDASNTPLVVGAGADVSVTGFSLECAIACPSIVTDHGTLALDDDQVNGGGLSGGVLEQAQGSAATELSLVGTTVEATYSAYGGVYSGPADGATGGRSLVIAGSTIYNNVASSGAGGVSVASSTSSPSTATIIASTITDNVGPGSGGVFGVVSLANTIVAGNSSGSIEDDCGAQVTDAPGGHNLIESSTCGLLAAGVNGDQLSVGSPGLGTLANNGGPTDTVALRVGSPAISAGDAATCEAAPISDLDQRGLPRNATTRGTCDIGAYDTDGTAVPTWTPGPAGPPARSAPALATDPAGLTLLFGGGGSGNSFLSDTWELSSPSGAWQQVAGHGPSGRTGANLVWDPTLSEFVLFGGVSSTGFLSDTWVFNPASNSWSQLSPKGAPTPRAGAALVAEPDGDIVLFGGLTYTGYLADTWVYSPPLASSAGGTWTEEHPASIPSARYEPAAAASLTGAVVLFGGAGAKGDDADTWSYTLSNDTWAELSPSGTVPPARYGAGLAYDSASGNFVLVDGATAAGYSGATYTLNAGTNVWATLATMTSPSSRAAAGFAYDAPANVLVQCGGWNGSNFLADTWELPG